MQNIFKILSVAHFLSSCFISNIAQDNTIVETLQTIKVLVSYVMPYISYDELFNDVEQKRSKCILDGQFCYSNFNYISSLTGTAGDFYWSNH